MGPHAFRLVVGGDAYDGEGLPGDHARADGDVGGGDVRADDGEGLSFAHALGEAGEHDARPGGAASPQKAPREGVAPGEVVDGTRRAGEHRRHLVAVHAHAAEVEHVEHLDVQVLRAGDAIAKGRVVAQKLERLRDGVRRAAMARADRGVHHDDRRARRIVGGAGPGLLLGRVGDVGGTRELLLGRIARDDGNLALGCAGCVARGRVLHFTGEFHVLHAIRAGLALARRFGGRISAVEEDLPRDEVPHHDDERGANLGDEVVDMRELDARPHAEVVDDKADHR